MKSTLSAVAILSVVPLLACDGPVRPGGEVDAVRTCGAVDQAMPVGFRIDLPEGVVEPVPTNNLTVTYDARGTLSEAALVDEMCVTPCPVTSFGFQERCPILPQGQRVDCSGAAVSALRFVVEENPGRRWTVTVSPQGVVDQWVSAARQALGKTVGLQVRYRTVFQTTLAPGFVLNDEIGLVLASDGGRFVNAFEASDVPAVKVSAGQRICRQDCTYLRSLTFGEPASPPIGLDRDGTLRIGAHLYSVRNGGSAEVTNACPSDTEAASPWSIWRKT